MLKKSVKIESINAIEVLNTIILNDLKGDCLSCSKVLFKR